VAEWGTRLGRRRWVQWRNQCSKPTSGARATFALCTGKKRDEDNWCSRCGKVQMAAPKWWENLDVCDACDAALVADAVAIERAEIAECDRQIRELVTTLSAVLSIQSRSACSPEERVAYDKAKALLSEHGVGGVPEEMREKHREWEAKR
jgi:hypothetical protein